MIVAATSLLLLALAAIFSARPKWGLYALVATMPFEWIGSWALNARTGHPVINLAEVVAAAWLIGLAYDLIVRKRTLTAPPWPWRWLAGFIVWAGVSAIHIGHHAVFESFVIVLLLFAITTAIAMTASWLEPKKLMATLMASAGLVCLFGIYQFVMGTFRILKWSFLRAPYIRDLFGFPRIHSVLSEPLYFANYLLIPLLLGLAYLLIAPKMLATWQKVVVGLVALDFLLTMSRGAIIALVPALVILVIGLWRMHGPKVRWKPVVYGAVSILLLGAISVGVASGVATGDPLRGLENFGSQLTVKLFSTGSFYDRESQSSLGLTIARANPIFGVALEGVTPYVHGYDAARRPNDVIALNNQAVELLAETGIVGTVLFYVFLISLAVVAWREYPRIKSTELRALLLGSLVVIIAMTLQAQSFTGFFLVPYWVVYGLVLAGITLGLKKAAPSR